MLDHLESISKFLVFKTLNESLELVSWDRQLLNQYLDETGCVVLNFRRWQLEEHDEEVARGETRTVLDDLAQVVGHKTHHVV